jgi:hypothetical protein
MMFTEKRRFAILALLASSAMPASAVEIATGKMLGPSYEPRAFYIRDKAGQPWRKTYTGRRFRPAAAGRLMNLRIAQALFHDEWLTEFPFDPEKNTDRLIAALDTYKAHGILSINTSLQAGNPGYAKEFPAIQRDRAYKLGPGKGSHISAFKPDGSIKPEWLGRLKRLQQALDRRGMILNFMYFYQGQDEVFQDVEAIKRAVVNATDWLIDNNARNVVIDIANEHDIRGWDHDRWIHENMHELITLVRSRFREKKAGWIVPVGSSTGGSMRVFDNVRDHADLTIIHGNNRTVEQRRARVAELFADPKMPGPIFMNEDDSGRETTQEVLAKELAACDAVFSEGGSWGYMPWRQTQMFPFRHYMPAKSSKLTPGMPLEESGPVYFKAVLEHMRKLVLR